MTSAPAPGPQLTPQPAAAPPGPIVTQDPQQVDGPVLAGPIRRPDGLPADQPPRSIHARIPVLFNPFLRLLLFVLLAVAVAIPLVIGMTLLVPPASNPPVHVQFTAQAILQILVAVLAYLLLTLLIERRRPPVELAPRRLLGLPVGLGAGAVAFGVVYLLIWAFGGFAVSMNQVDPAQFWAGALMLGAGAGIAEEIVFRGVLYRFLEETLGTWVAVGVSGLAFGLVHMSNPDATLWGAIAIGIEAGVLLGLLYAWTRSLWVAIGFHAAWNLVQGSLLGVIVSGTGEPNGLLRSTPQGNELISGGQFGAEASVVAVAVLLACSVVLAIRMHRRGEIVAPMWTRRTRQKAALPAGPTVPPADPTAYQAPQAYQAPPTYPSA